MQASPLQLESYAFRRVEIEAGVEPVEQADLALQVLQVSLECGRHEKRNNHFKLGLTVKFTTEDSVKKLGYKGTVVIDGLFFVVPEYPEDRWVEVATVNGASLLFGAVREMVANITARGPWPAVQLSTVNFIDMVTRRPTESKDDQSQASQQDATHSLEPQEEAAIVADRVS